MFFSAAGEMGYFSRRWCHLLVWEMSCAVTFCVSAASLSSPSICNAVVRPGGSMHRSGLVFQAFSPDCFLDLGAEEHRKHLKVRAWGCFVNNYYYFCIKANVTISGVCETESFGVLFFINGVLKNSALLELLLSLHEIWRRKLRLWGSKSPACYWALVFR